MTQGRNQNRADAKTAAAGEIDLRIAFGIVAQHDFSRAYGFGRNSHVGLQANAKIGRGTAGTGAADDIVPSAQGDGGSGGAGQVLGAFGDGTDRGLEIEFGGMNFD